MFTIRELCITLMKSNRGLFWLCCIVLFWSCLCAGPTAGQSPSDANIVSVKAYASHASIHPGEPFQVAILADIRSGFHVNSHTPLDEFLIPTVVKLDESQNITFSPVSYPQPEYKSFSFSSNKVAVYEGKLAISARGRLSQDVMLGDVKISGVLSYQACNNASCFMPSSVRFEVPLKVVNPGEPMALINDPVFRDNALFTADEMHAKQIVEGGIAYAIITFFLFGLALNLTPCVYPVIPITLSFFAAQGKQKKSRIFLVASYYVLGIAISFSVLGLISALAGRQWGFLFQNPWFVILISIILLSMAASMFGAFELTIPSFLMTPMSKSREGAVGSMVMGLTVGVVIAPCAAGIIVGLIGVVAKQGMAAKGTLLFFVMGLGLGLPYLLLATCTGLLDRLPRSGMWMVWVRKLFGIFLVGAALYFLVPQGKQMHDQEGFYLGVLGIFGGILLGFLERGEGYTGLFRIIRGILGCLLILVGTWMVYQAMYTKVESIDWVHYDNQPVELFQKENRAILLDFYADWCPSCKELDRKTFADKKVREASRQFVMIRVNCTSPDAGSGFLTRKYNVSGLPTIVFINANGEELPKLRAVGFLDPSEMLERMVKATAQQTD